MHLEAAEVCCGGILGIAETEEDRSLSTVLVVGSPRGVQVDCLLFLGWLNHQQAYCFAIDINH